MTCHGVVRHEVGPPFAAVADRYRNDNGALLRLSGKIRSGSVGTWGRVVMPPQTQVTPADAQLLARWILSLPSAQPADGAAAPG